MAGAPDDSELMLRYQRGDLEAFRELYHRHRGPLYRYFLRSFADPQTAADLFQEAWTKIIGARRRYRRTAKFTTYMYRIAHNCAVDHLRRHSRNPTADPALCEDPEAAPDPEDAADATAAWQLRERFARALAELPEDQRTAFLLREEGGLSLAEIAATTGVPEETAKSRLRYAVRKLRAALGDVEPE